MSFCVFFFSFLYLTLLLLFSLLFFLLSELSSIQPAEVRTFFGDHGIELTEAETKSLFFVFDANDDKKLSRAEFMNFAQQAQTSTLNPTSEFWVKLLAKNDDSGDSRVATIADWDDGERDKCLRELKEMASHNLQALERTKVIEQGSPPFPPRLKMERLPSDTPGEQTTTLRLHWTPGSAKDLRGGAESLKDKGKNTGERAPVVFFMLETGGPMTGHAIKKFVELCKDPPSVSGNDGGGRGNGAGLRGGYIHMDLQPNTRYQYRLTAFNGFGPSEPVYSSFTTLPMAPPVPRLVASAVTVNKASVTLEWGEGEEFKSKMKELRRAFVEMDRDANGDLSREEFLVALTAQPHLREFLTWSTDMSPTELFEGIDGDADGRLTFAEFSHFFLRRVRTNTQRLRPANAEAGEGRFEGDVEVKVSDSGAAVSTGTKFVLNKCVSDVQPPVFTRVTGAPTHKTRWTVEDLVPGQSYQFTVHAMNLDGEIGPASKATIVSTMMQQPTSPRVIGTPSLDSLQLKWSPAPELDLAAFMLSDNKNKNSSLRRSAPTATSLRASADADLKNPLRASAQISATSTGGDWFKQLNDWASTKSKDGADYAEGGVGSSTVKRMFDRYDVDGSGQLDTHELRSFLKDMGMPYDDDGVDACLIELDSNDDGKVSLNEFITKFWNKHVVSYIVKRDAGTTDAMLAMTGGRVPTSGGGRKGRGFDVCFIGREPQCTVADLAPNTMYRFTVQFRSHRASSPPSTELHIMTPPGPPTQPVAVHTGAREATLKWYPGAGGAAFKYQVYFQRVASRLGSSNDSSTKQKKKKSNSSKTLSREWEKCYEGSDTVCRITDKLEPDSMYNFKVIAMNRQYVCGDASLPTQVCTVRKQDEVACTRDTVDDVFSIDCTGDVVTGDTILFTERVYAAVKAKPESVRLLDA
jgi:Ca2+-binding EF-hand superfamily protein